MVRRALPLLALLGLTGAAPRVEAHEGPPFPILVDRTTRYGLLSVWGDPDVGTGTFWIHLEPAGAGTPDDVEVNIVVRPMDDRLPAQRYAARSTHQAAGDRRFQGEVQFDAPGPWRVRFDLSGARGPEALEEKVEVTLPGQGPVLDFILYSFPFLAFGVLFVLVMVRRRR